MEWFKHPHGLTSHPYIQAADYAEPGAGFTLIQGLEYCTRVADVMAARRPDGAGFIPDYEIIRFGGKRLEERIQALVTHRALIRVEDEGGYLVNPALWNEDNNLNDSAEKKRAADAARMRANRAAARASAAEETSQGNAGAPSETTAEPTDVAETPRDLSRDCRATPLRHVARQSPP